MRNAFADEITKIGAMRNDLALLSGDIGNRLFDVFKTLPNCSFINCGIAEANMMGVAAGLALSGLKPIVYTITPFTTTRCYEQIRIDACYHNIPIIIVGTGSGLSYASLGPTHHSLEDLAILRALPHMTVMAPADELELRMCLNEALKLNSPVYIRIGKKGEKIVTRPNQNLKIGEAINHKKGKDIAFIASGTILSNVLDACELLEQKGIKCSVDSFHTIKPLDIRSLNTIFEEADKICMVEEHGSIGGLFGAVSEWYAQSSHDQKKLFSFGTPDEFMHEIGSQTYARDKYGLSVQKIYLRALEIAKSKE